MKKLLLIIVAILATSLSAQEPLHIFYVSAPPFVRAAGPRPAIIIRVRARDRIDALIRAAHATVWTEDEWREAKKGLDNSGFKMKIVDDSK